MSQIKSYIMQIIKSSETTNQETQNNKMKRKKFFLTTAYAAAGIFTFTKLPFSIFRAKTHNEKNVTIQITENPNAIKRKTNKYGNG